MPGRKTEADDGRDPWHHERALHRLGYARVVGVDEAGRGPLAGPVVAAAVILPPYRRLERIRDSKQLPPREREALCRQIRSHALTLRKHPQSLHRFPLGSVSSHALHIRSRS